MSIESNLESIAKSLSVIAANWTQLPLPMHSPAPAPALRLSQCRSPYRLLHPPRLPHLSRCRFLHPLLHPFPHPLRCLPLLRPSPMLLA